MRNEELAKEREGVTFIEWFVSDKMVLFSTIFILIMTVIAGIITHTTDYIDAEYVLIMGILFGGIYLIVPFKVIQSYRNFKDGFSR